MSASTKDPSRLVAYLLTGISHGLRAGQAIVIAVFFAQVFSKSDFGKIGYALAMSSMFLPLFEMGCFTILVREFSRESKSAHGWFSASIQAKFFVSILIPPFAYYLSRLLDGGDEIPMLTMLLSLNYLFRIGEPYEMWAIAKRDFAVPAIARGGSFLVLLGALVLAALNNASMATCCLIYAVASASYSAIIIPLTIKRCAPPAFDWRIHPKIVRTLFKEAFPLLLSGMAVTLYMRLDCLMLLPYHGATAVATYLAATRISQGLYMIPIVMVDAIFPSLARIPLNEPQGIRRWQEAMDYQVIMGYLLVLVSLVSAPWLIPLVFGAEYQDSVRVFQLHSMSVLFVAVGAVSSRYLAASHKQIFTLVSTVSGFATNLLLNLWLIPRYGAVGAAISAASSQLMCCTLIYAFIPQTRALFNIQLRSFFLWFSFSRLREASTKMLYLKR